MADTSGLGGFGKHHSSSTFGGVDELLAAIDAQVEESNKAAAGAFEFVERMRDIRGEGESKDHAVRVVVDSSGTPIEVQVPDHPALGHAFLEAFKHARQDVGARVADAAVDAYGDSSIEAQVQPMVRIESTLMKTLELMPHSIISVVSMREHFATAETSEGHLRRKDE